MGTWHARYAARTGAEIVAIVDRRPDAATALRRGLGGAEPFGSLEEALGHRDIEVVHVCTSLDGHVPLAEAALRAGKHVLVEKPIAASSEKLARLLDLAGARGLVLAAVHQLPFQHGFNRLRSRLPRLGELIELRYVVCSAGGEGRTESARRTVLLEMLPHPVSLFRRLLGELPPPETLSVDTFTADELEIAGRLGPTRLAISIGLRGRPTRHELIATGTRGSAWLDLFHGYGVFDTTGISRASKALAPFRRGAGLLLSGGGNLASRALRREPAYPGLRDLIERFYRAVRGEAPAPVSSDEMKDTIRWLEVVGSSRRG